MGMWLELGIFIIVLAWAFWQLHDVKKAKRERIEKERAAKLLSGDGTDN
ncbi:MAG: hypothetical protein V4731_07775 [Pseudomonadota bacterium]